MYDQFHLVSNTDIARPARTRFYHLAGELNRVDRTLTAPRWDPDKNYIFTNTNGTDSHYLINTQTPSIDNRARLVPNESHAPANRYDVVFISNGEANAEANYQHLLGLGISNRIHRVQDVQGRTQAYRVAAHQSNTPYFFAVFAKLEVNPAFDFSFGCEAFDRRHYVFRATNPVNGLEYGHQGMILYNRENVLANPGTALDFTMAQLFREIPRVSGVAHFNSSPLAAWRCAFREVLKLAIAGDADSLARIAQWQTGRGAYSIDSVQGATDALRFHSRFKDQPSELYRSYEWAWLEQYWKAQ